MKKIKTRIGLALGAFASFLASPAVAMAAEEETRSFGETMEYALLNTLMGISIVFLSLFLISRIIALFKYVNKFEANHSKNAAEKNAPAAPVPEPEPEVIEEEDLSDDMELVAVITAAIAAYEEENGGEAVPADQLVVKSIKRVNRARWQNA